MDNKKDLTEKMSKSSDQKVPTNVAGEQAFGRNIKDMPEAELKRKAAEKMSKKS